MKLLPSAEEAEKGLLCSFFIAWLEVGALCAEIGLGIAHFHNPAHAALFPVLMEEWREQRPCDIISITQKLYNKGLLDEVGGAAYVTELSTHIPTPAHARFYADILEEKRLLRALHAACTKGAANAIDEQEQPLRLIAGHLEEVAAIAQPKTTAKTWKQLLGDKIERIETEQEPPSIRTGLDKLDHHSPLYPGNFIIISGERKAGKSMLALTIAANLARRSIPVLYFSLEEKSPKVMDRLFAGASSVPTILHTAKDLSEDRIQRFHRATHDMQQWDFTIRDDVFDLAAMLSVSRQWHSKHQNGVVFLDYLQLVRSERRKGETHENEVAGVSRALRLLGMELNAAIVALSQLNKDGDTKYAKAIEQDCTAMWRVTLAEKDGIRTIAVPFQRDGESGIKFDVAFRGQFARMENLAA